MHARGMVRVPVTSSDLRSVGYLASEELLEIEFHSGGLYQYLDVPDSVHEELVDAASVGTYFHAHIKDQYSTTRIS